MAIDDFKRYYHHPDDFPALVGPLSSSFEFLKAGVDELILQNTPRFIEQADSATVLIHWPSWPGEPTLDAIQTFFDGFVGGATTDAPIELNNWDPHTNPTQDFTYAIDHTSGPLKFATYQVILNSMHRMTADTPGQGSQLHLRVDRSDGAFYEQFDATALFFTQAVNLPLTFTVTEGQTIRVRIGVKVLTGAGGTSELTGARATIDKI